MNLEYYNMSKSEFEQYLNNAKNLVVHTMFRQGLISEEVAKEVGNSYGIIIKKPSFFNNFWKKLYNKNEDILIVVKNLSLEEKNETKKNE